jgi:3-hydroxymyristoyl/3-hydroxydecanoyl-(acyl carrier protein) dehydratase
LVGKIAELQEKNMVKKVDFLNHNQVNNLIPEEPPALGIDRAVLLGIDGDELALCTTRINEQMCQGHFPFAPVLPLATAAQYAGQAGEVLINSVTNQNRQITHAVLVTETRGRRNKVLKKDFLFPGDDILYIATYKGQKNDCECALTEIYNRGTLMGILKEIDFRLLSQKSIQDHYLNRLEKHV